MDSETKSPSKETTAISVGKVVDLKICGVCGDRALGYNFNAVTCESCKAFFRRNALKNKEFRCPFNDSCEITMVTRRFCQRCRLVKCLSIGMRKDYIMSDEDKVIKKQKIEQNRARKRPSAQHSKLPKTEEDSCYETYDSGVLVITSAEDLDLEPRQKVWISTSSLNGSCEDINKLDSADSFKEIPVINVKMLPSESLPSPTGGASVPSPSSPPQSATVAASRTVEMVTERTHSSSAVSVITSPRPSNKQHPSKNDMPLLSSLINNQRSDETSSDSTDHSVRVTKNVDVPPPKVIDSCWGESDQVASSSFYLSTKEAAKEIIQDVQRTTQRLPLMPTSIESILSEAIKLEFEAYSSLAQSHHHNSRELNDAERAKLNELIVANKALHDPLDHDLSTLIGDDCRFKSNVDNSSPVLLDVINLTAVAIRRLIKTSKKINAFKNMCQEDQVALLKGGCTEMLILRSAMTYDPDKNSWNIPHTQERLNVKVDVLKEARGNIYEEHQRFLRTFEPRWRMDENIMLILSAITLFTPDRAHVVHHDVIRLEQNSYYYLLRRYLESIYLGCEARSTFLKLIQKIAELHRLNDEHVKVYLDVNPRDVEPLLIEIFDLNSASLRPDRNM